jgi:benzylsuccinate CoA-transferase BbsF subunit
MGLLTGIRIVDVTRIYAGPRATYLLAAMGAECIKVESKMNPDLLRLGGTVLGTPKAASMAFAALNLGKLSVTINLKHPKGVEIFKQLVHISDVVIDNSAPGTMDKFGLGYKDLKEVNPAIIMLSMSSHGAFGPERDYLSGMSSLAGYPDGPPEEIRSGADIRTGTWGALAVLAALNYRQRTGKGQFIDLSARECLSCQIGESIMEYAMNNTMPSRNANGDDVMAPHNCYPCKGEDKWISIAIASDEEWNNFCNAIGNPEWSRNEKFSNQDNRWQNQEELDKLIAEWTAKHTHYEVMEILQGAGVAAVPSFSNEDLWQDRHSRERDLFKEVMDPEMGRQVVLNLPWKLSASPSSIARAPILGEHNRYVFRELLGIPEEEFFKLKEEEVI